MATGTAQEKAEKKKVAIIPVQKSLPVPIYLSTHPSLFNSLKRSFEEKRLDLKSRVDYDPEFVLKTLNELITEKVLGRGFLVFAPQQTGPRFKELTRGEQQMPLDELNEPFHADAMLLITITEWDTEQFDNNGTAVVGFEAVLIDVKSKQTIWSNQATGLKLHVPSKDFLYYKYERDVLSDLSSRILKGFPKNDWPVS